MILSDLSSVAISQLTPEEFRRLAVAHNAAQASLTTLPLSYEDQRRTSSEDAALRDEVFAARIDPEDRYALVARLEGAKLWAEACRLKDVSHYGYDPAKDHEAIRSARTSAR